MNLKEILRQIRADYQEKRNIEALRQKRAQDLLYLNHPELKELEQSYKRMNLEILKEALIQPLEVSGAELHLLELEREFLASKEKLLQDLGYQKDPRNPHYDCPICQDTGESDQGMCLCLKQELAGRIFRAEYERGRQQPSLSEMGFNLYSSTKEKGKTSQRDNILEIVSSLQNFVRDFDENQGTNIIFSGGVSQAKTFLSAALAMELIDDGRLVIYQTVPALIDKLRDLSWRYDEDNADLKALIYDCDMLILDDLGQENRTDFAQKELFHLINMRYTAGRKTLISTNLKLKEIKRDYGEAFFSRLLEDCYVPDFFGPDLRLGG